MIEKLTRPVVARVLAWLACAGVLATVAAGVIGHLEPVTTLNPLSMTISDFAISDGGGAIELAMVILALASLALLAGLLAARTRIQRIPALLLLVWVVGLLVSAAVPTDPLSAPALTVSGQVHRYASIAAFVSLPAAAYLLLPRLAQDSRWAGVVPQIRSLAVGSGIGLLVLFYTAFPGDRVLLGLAERVLVAVEIALLAMLAMRLTRIARPGRLANVG